MREAGDDGGDGMLEFEGGEVAKLGEDVREG